MLFCNTFSKDTKCTNHISDWFNFCSCFVLGKNNRLKKPADYHWLKVNVKSKFLTVPDKFSIICD